MTKPTAAQMIEAATQAALAGESLEQFSGRALKAAKKALVAEWPVRRIIKEHEAYRAVSAAIARIDEEFNAREADNRIAPRKSFTRGFEV
jgi:hypothetical protein